MSRKLYAGIDLGGTKILALIADAEGNVVGDQRLATEAVAGPDAVIERMVQATCAAAKEAGIGLDELTAAGVAAPGPIDAAEGVITDPPNLPGWHDVPLAKALQRRLGIAAILENDANCGAIGEHRYGSGRGCRHMIYITLSTGIGGGIIIDNRLYAGASGAAGEIGHIGVSADGPRCGAGHVGCLEAFSSGTAIAHRAQQIIDSGGMARTARLAAQHPPLSAETVALAAQQGDEEAAAVIDSAGRYLGIGLASILNAFNPERIVLGGGLVHIGEALLGPALDVARERAFEQAFEDATIVEWELGERVAALGAIAVAENA